MKRHATAFWKGPGKEGLGSLTTQSMVLQQTPYTFNSRFSEEAGTNPEELVAAAHAGCFTMKLSFVLGEAGFVPDTLETTAYIHFENGAITVSHLLVTATVPQIDQRTFEECVREAEHTCPLSRVLQAKITVETVLNS